MQHLEVDAENVKKCIFCDDNNATPYSYNLLKFYKYS